MSKSAKELMESSTFRTIEKRLADLSPAIVLQKHIASDLEVAGNTLDGIKFAVKNRNDLLTELRVARDSIGQIAFAEGSKIDPKHWNREGIKGDPKHWALNLSFAATNGIGFREIWRFRLTNRSLRLSDARPPGHPPLNLDGRFSAHFGDNLNVPDITSLHLAVWDEQVKKTSKTFCTAHIDEAGFVIEGPGNELMLTPDMLQHGAIELGWKTKLRGKLPDWAVDRINPFLPSSFNDFSRAGVGIDAIKTGQYKLSVVVSCGIFGGFECSGTVNLTGTHNIWGSK